MDFKQQILKALREAVGELVNQDLDVQLEHPTVTEHGDYSTNVAMAAWKAAGGSTSPMQFATALKAKLEQSEQISNIVDQIDVVAPGFINFWISEKELVGEVSEILKLGEKYGKSTRYNGGVFEGQTVVVDYSGPNIAKPFGIGHLRSTIIGQAVYNLYKFLGANVIGDNHLGDWGRQFGVLLYQIVSKDLNVDQLSVDELEKLYVEFHKDAEKDEKLWDDARLWFKKLEDGDAQAREIWQKVKDISLNEFKRVYKLLNVDIDYAYGESFYSTGDHEGLMPEVIQECQKKGIARISEGALIVEFPDPSAGAQGYSLPPAILKKSDGTTNYFTRDLATIKFRLKEWNPSLIVYEVGAEQSLHFQQLFKTVEMLQWSASGPVAGFLPASAPGVRAVGSPPPRTTRALSNTLTMLVHLKHGLYLASSGKKFSTRKGDTVHLEEVLEEAIERAKALGKEVDEDVAQMVGVGAVKYFDLSHHPSSNIVFDWGKIMSLEGNSAPYLQYTFARCRSVIARARSAEAISIDEIATLSARDDGGLKSEELVVLRTLYRFPEVIEDAAKNFSPNLLCNFLFDLAQKYNAFYNQHRILEAEENREFRISLTAATGNILKTGLGLLGIEAPERM